MTTRCSGTITTAFLRGDLNHNGIPADAGDLVLMKRAAIGDFPVGYNIPEYDLNFNGIGADAGDLVLMKRAAIGEIDLNQPPYNAPITTGTLAITSTPAGATITIYGVVLPSSSPFTFALPPGTYTVLLQKTGFQDWQGTVTVAANQTTTVNPSLTSTVV